MLLFFLVVAHLGGHGESSHGTVVGKGLVRGMVHQCRVAVVGVDGYWRGSVATCCGTLTREREREREGGGGGGGLMKTKKGYT